MTQGACAGSGGHTETVLLQMLVASLKKAHWKVACRRYLMLVSGGWQVPQPLLLACEARLPSARR